MSLLRRAPALTLLVMLGPVLAVLGVDDDHARGVGLAVSGWRSAAVLLAVLATFFITLF